MIRPAILMTVATGIILFGCNTEGEQNFEDLKKVELGMERSMVDTIMGNPPINSETANWSDSLFVESYESGFGASDYYKIIYSKKDSVVVDVGWGD